MRPRSNSKQLNTNISIITVTISKFLLHYSNNQWLDRLLTLQRMEKLAASFIVSQWPSESLDKDRTSGAVRASVACEESKQILDNVSELPSAPVITQSHDCRQRHAEEEQCNAVGT